MFQNSIRSIEQLPEEGYPKILFHISSYWPAISGASLHTRKLIHYLSDYHENCVVRHSADEPTSNEVAFARNPSLQLTDGRTPIYQIGAHPNLAWGLHKLAPYYADIRWVRPFYNQMLKMSVSGPINRIAESYDIVHAVYTGMRSSVRAAQIIAKRQKKPFVLTPIAHVEQSQTKATPAFKRLYRDSDALIAMTEFEQEWLVRQGVQRERIHVCPMGPIVSEHARPIGFRKNHQLGQDPVVLFMARQVLGNGYQSLASAARHVWQQFPKTRFVFIGSKTSESLAFFKDFRDPRLLNLGEVSLEDKTSALAACDLLCVPSIYESMGVKYLEAWLYEKPVIAADIPAMHSVIQHEQDGLIVSPTPTCIASGILRLLNNPKWRHELGYCGYRKVRSKYEWRLIANQLSDVYQSLSN